MARPGASARSRADAVLTQTVIEVHPASRATYGAPRVHAEPRLGSGIACGRTRSARSLRSAGLAGVCHHRAELVVDAAVAVVRQVLRDETGPSNALHRRGPR
ncbi:transposase [Kineococcus sp. SYSU DK003]|uniref:transposase n=1 Tax=Kineococcus sp. SYSU DK003 TaxID=3383124 RepID=UPI003D7E324D